MYRIKIFVKLVKKDIIRKLGEEVWEVWNTSQGRSSSCLSSGGPGSILQCCSRERREDSRSLCHRTRGLYQHPLRPPHRRPLQTRQARSTSGLMSTPTDRTETLTQKLVHLHEKYPYSRWKIFQLYLYLLTRQLVLWTIIHSTIALNE